MITVLAVVLPLLAPGATAASKDGFCAKPPVTRVVKANYRRIRQCYTDELKTTEGLSGKLRISWVIQPSGRTARVTLDEDTVAKPAVSACVVGVISSLRFPKPVGGVDCAVSMPFIFKPGRTD